MKTARGYSRLSGSDSERSIPAQKRAIREYCENRDDLELEFIYDEGRGESGWDTSREEYNQMKDDASNGEFDCLVVRAGSRIGRDSTERLDTYLDLANKHGVEFHTCQRGFVDPDNTADLIREVFESKKDDEKKKEINMAIKEIKKRQREGYWQGRPPKGLEHNSSLEPPGLEPTHRFTDILNLINAKAQGLTHSESLRFTDYSNSRRDIVTNVMDNIETYEQVAEQEGYWFSES